MSKSRSGENSKSGASKKSGPVQLSIVVPMHNESPVLDAFYERTVRVIYELDLRAEIICVDDGSADDTAPRLRDLHARDSRVKCVFLSRNFGKEIALSAGLDHAQGELIVPIAAGLQDPPELIPEMIAKLENEGYDVIYMCRMSRTGDAWLRRLGAQIFYSLLSRTSDVPLPRGVGDFRIFRRRVLNALQALPERRRFMRGLFAWVGFRQASLPYHRAARVAGKSSWSYWQLWNYAVESLTSFSVGPLRFWTRLGVLLAPIAFGLAIWLGGQALLAKGDVPGHIPLLIAVLVLGGVQLISFGLLGEYTGRIFYEVKGRPLYIIRERCGDLPPD